MLSAVFAVATWFASVQAFPICKNDAGKAVDSWFMVKAPKGTESLYYDATTNGFVTPVHDMNSTTKGALATTLQQLWSEQTTNYLIFNDEPAGSTFVNFTVGHTKGVWAWNVAEDSAIILQHSVPLFPLGPSQVTNYKGLGGNAWMYGQHLACFTLSVADLATLAEQTVLTVPDIYDSRVTASAPASLQALANGAISLDPVCTNTTVPTSGGLELAYYTKSTQWNNELYAACIAPNEQTPLLVESWIRGSAEGPSCGAEPVLDVRNVSYPTGIAFSEYNDHSKWAVSSTSDLVCASDINRMTTQYKRGGSAFCFHDATLAASLRSAAIVTDACSEFRSPV
jgi:deoxyribonuclease-2